MEEEAELLKELRKEKFFEKFEYDETEAEWYARGAYAASQRAKREK